jgi:hypothetical protein
MLVTGMLLTKPGIVTRPYPQMVRQRCHEGVTSAPRQDNSLEGDMSVISDVVVKMDGESRLKV